MNYLDTLVAMTVLCDADASRTPAGRAARAAQVAMPALEVLHPLDHEPATFLCMGCGEVEHPAEPGDDDSTWCECGRRLDPQRHALGL